MIGMLFLGLVAGYALGYTVMLCKHIRQQRELGKHLDVMIAAGQADSTLLCQTPRLTGATEGAYREGICSTFR